MTWRFRHGQLLTHKALATGETPIRLFVLSRRYEERETGEILKDYLCRPVVPGMEKDAQFYDGLVEAQPFLESELLPHPSTPEYQEMMGNGVVAIDPLLLVNEADPFEKLRRDMEQHQRLAEMKTAREKPLTDHNPEA